MMPLPRVIPCLLLKGEGFYKTRRFHDPVYLGDPVNILRIFNDKQADELIVLDIGARERGPDLARLTELAGECFMPLAYGGGITCVEQATAVLKAGFEKVCINSAAVDDPDLISRLADIAGSQSVVVSIDFQRSIFGGMSCWVEGGTRNSRIPPAELAADMERRGAGEILLNSIDRDGTMEGYDIEAIRAVAAAVSVPVIACGGAKDLSDFALASTAGASAFAAGAMFVFHGPRRGVLINMPRPSDVSAALASSRGAQ